MLSEHTDEVLAGLGLAAEAVAGLRAQGVVA
jgi:crotonobetainyl-CoA:carnitine CoA-transferase CaiB-like acyl-CoA transferase